MKEGNGFEWWKKEILEDEVGCRCRATGRRCRATGRRTAEPNDFFCEFLERRKRKWVGNFVVEARVDELCSSSQNGSENEIYMEGEK